MQTGDIATILADGGYENGIFDNWLFNSQWEQADYLLEENKQAIADITGEDEDDLSQETLDYVRDWFLANDTSDVMTDLLGNTRAQMFFIELGLDVYGDEKFTDFLKILKKTFKFKPTEKQIESIRSVYANAFYGSLPPVGFYFNLSGNDINTLFQYQRDETGYLTVKGAFFGLVDRVQGGGDLGCDAIFDIQLPISAIKTSIFLDADKNTGYGWGTIAGGHDQDEAYIEKTEKPAKGFINLTDFVTDKTEEINQTKEWDKDLKKGICHFEDPRYSSHDTEYINEFPCGDKCKKCGRFYID